MKELTTDAAFVCRRPFLRALSLLTGPAMVSPGGLCTVRTPQDQEAYAPQLPTRIPAVHTDRKSDGGRGATQRVGSEILEYNDEETGARVRRLTGDGSNNVHSFFTSESFFEGDGAGRLSSPAYLMNQRPTRSVRSSGISAWPT